MATSRHRNSAGVGSDELISTPALSSTKPSAMPMTKNAPKSSSRRAPRPTAVPDGGMGCGGVVSSGDGVVTASIGYESSNNSSWATMTLVIVATGKTRA